MIIEIKVSIKICSALIWVGGKETYPFSGQKRFSILGWVLIQKKKIIFECIWCKKKDYNILYNYSKSSFYKTVSANIFLGPYLTLVFGKWDPSILWKYFIYKSNIIFFSNNPVSNKIYGSANNIISTIVKKINIYYYFCYSYLP